MVRATAMYGRPADPGAFDAHYRDVHIPLLKRLPGVRHIFYGTAVDGLERGSDWYAIADAVFEDVAAMRAAFASPEWTETIADVTDLEVEVSVIFGTMTEFAESVSS